VVSSVATVRVHELRREWPPDGACCWLWQAAQR